MKILAIIPARGGSKGIKNKNIRQFAGRPLISYAINSAKKSKYIDRVIVSTDSDQIAKVAKKYGAEVPFLRPANLAQDKSSVVDAVIHLLKNLARENYKPDYIILLQPTSPLRTVEDIDGAIKLILKNKAESLVSVCATEQLVFTKKSNHILNLASSKSFLKSLNRQELPPTYKLDGSMIYIVKTNAFLKNKLFLTNRTIGYVIPRWQAVDLDEPEDFVVGELIYKNINSVKNRIKNFK